MSRLDDLRLNISPVLTGIAAGYTVSGVIGDKVLPVLPISGHKARLAKYGLDQLRSYDDTRALRALPKQAEWTPSYTDVTLSEHTIDIPRDWREEAAAKEAGIDALARSARTAKRSVVLGRELAVATKLQDINTYPTGHTLTPAAGSKWNEVDATTGKSKADPISVILAQGDFLRSKIGVRPNVFWCGAQAWAAISGNTNVLDRLAFAPAAISAKKVTEEAFASAIQVEKVLVGGAVHSTDGATVSDIWGDYAGLVYVVDNPGLIEAPTFGFLAIQKFGFDPEFSAYGFVSTWEDGGRYVQHVAYTEMYEPWIAMPEAGFLFVDVVA